MMEFGSNLQTATAKQPYQSKARPGSRVLLEAEIDGEGENQHVEDHVDSSMTSVSGQERTTSESPVTKTNFRFHTCKVPEAVDGNAWHPSEYCIDGPPGRYCHQEDEA